jgi:hypothetical protein
VPETHTSPFEIVTWQQSIVEEPDAGPAIARAEVHKVYRGDLAGTAVAQMVLCGESSYSGIERVTGSVGGRMGTFVLAHGATRGLGPEDHSLGVVVPGSGTGELSGLVGTAEFRHDGTGPSITLHYDFG